MIVLFEDSAVTSFHPVALTRHVSELLVGTATLRARVERWFGDAITVVGRSYIVRYAGGGDPLLAASARGGALFLNAGLLVDEALVRSLPADTGWAAYVDGRLAAARLGEADLGAIDWNRETFELPPPLNVRRIELPDAVMYTALWEMIGDNGARINADFAALSLPAVLGNVAPTATLIGADAMSIAATARIGPGAVLDATTGPIVIGEDVEVMAMAVVMGPCSIGAGTRVKVGAKIYGMTSIGPHCKVGGEIENSIIIGYSNKQHDGFLGHSYLGKWVNLGADTNTSDLKNNYGMIRIHVDGREVSTGRMFLGSLMADHVKTGINTMLNTGTVIGVAANVFGAGFPPKNIPSFAWGGADGFERFELDRAIDVARTVMARRGITITDADIDLLRYLWQQSDTHSAQ